jgi:CBS domain-containing protein
MRICEVMSRPVVTVQPDTQLKDVAATLVEHGINAAPVIDASDRVVGIVARRDLLRLVARSDDDIRADLEVRLKEELDALRRLAVAVDGGVVTLDAAAGPLGRQLLEELAHGVPGVIEVRTSQPAEADRR